MLNLALVAMVYDCFDHNWKITVDSDVFWHKNHGSKVQYSSICLFTDDLGWFGLHWFHPWNQLTYEMAGAGDLLRFDFGQQHETRGAVKTVFCCLLPPKIRPVRGDVEPAVIMNDIYIYIYNILYINWYIDHFGETILSWHFSCWYFNVNFGSMHWWHLWLGQSLIGSSVAAIIGLSNNDWIQVQSGDIRLRLSFHKNLRRQMGVS